MKLRSYLFVLAGLGVVLLFVGRLKYYPDFVERFYSNGLYPVVNGVLSSFFNLFPFSVGDILYSLLIIFLAYYFFLLVQNLFRKNFTGLTRQVLRLLIGTEACILVFYLFWGMNYFRPKAAVRLGLTETGYTVRDLQTVTRSLIDSANFYRARLNKEDFQISDRQIYREARQYFLDLSGESSQFRVSRPRIKPSLLTPLINYTGVSGYFNPFTSESQVNYAMPVHLKPFVACHEIAHQAGFGAEDEANFAGFLAGIRSGNDLFRYAAWYEAVDQFMKQVLIRDTVVYVELAEMISDPVKEDFMTDYEYWVRYVGPARTLSSAFYDQYLKINNQPEGLRTYNEMVSLLIAWRRSVVSDQ